MTVERTVTRLLAQWTAGDPEALDELVPVVIGELRGIAAGLMRGERPGHTLQTTALVNELYLRLRKSRTVSWKNRAQFLGFTAQAMRRILVDGARSRARAKRGTGQESLTLEAETAAEGGGLGQEDLLALDEALERLERLDPRQCRVVELRYFLGLSLTEVAEVLGTSVATVKRDWATARAWLYRELHGGPP